MGKHLRPTNGREKKTARATSSADGSGLAIDTTAIAAETEVARGSGPSQTDLPRSTPDVTQPAACKPPGDGPEPAVGAEPLLHAGKESLPSERPARNKGSLALARTATGPRTPEGMRRSSRNALKHGIFARAVLLKDESRNQFNSVHSALREDLQPVGALEEFLVEKIAVVVWRQRRLYKVEAAEAWRNIRSRDWQESRRESQEFDNLRSDVLRCTGGLMRRIRNPLVVALCWDLFGTLRQGIAADGFVPERDEEILTQLYGDSDADHPKGNLLASYTAWLAKSDSCGQDSEPQGHLSPRECKQRFLQEIGSAMRSLKRCSKIRESIEGEERKLDQSRYRVLGGERLEQLLKYEAALERLFDRTLSQLERLQRMRLGQPAPPEIKLSVST